MPWREFVPADQHPESNFIVSIFMERIYGSRDRDDLHAAWFSGRRSGRCSRCCSGTRASRTRPRGSGYFFKAFGRLHAKDGFPYVSLLVLGAISILACLFSLGVVIDGLIATRILVQFIGQVVGVIRLRRTRPEMPRPYRMWLYPLPAIVALLGWTFVFLTTDIRVIGFGAGILLLGGLCFLVWSHRTREWPFRAEDA